MSTSDLRGLIALLFVTDARERGLAADGAVDWLDSIDRSTGEVMSRALEVALLLEDSPEALEAQLHALAELAAWNLVPSDVLQRVPGCRPWTQPWAIEYVDYLGEQLRRS